MAYAKLATRDEVLGPFYIDDRYVKEVDENQNPLKIEVTLGRYFAVAWLRSACPVRMKTWQGGAE